MNDTGSGARRVLAAGSIGTILEYYDLYIFGAAAGLVFATAYFPAANPTAAALAAMATFAVAFIARPLGAIAFGHLGDRAGRKKALQLTFLSMGTVTVLIGLLPTYLTIGLAAPILLVLLRLVQGFSVGGEAGGAFTVLVESAPAGRRGLYGSFVSLSSTLGSALGALMFVVMGAVLDENSFQLWGWRVPFLLAAFLLPLGVYVRRNIDETPDFVAASAERPTRAPIVALMRESWRQVLLVAGMSTGYLAGAYAVVVYGVAFLRETGASAAFATVVPLAYQIFTSVLSIPAGLLADRWGALRVFLLGLLGLLGLMVYAFPFFYLLGSHNPGLVVLAVILMGIPISLQGGAIGTLLAEMFRTRVRWSGVSLGFQLGSIVGGGLTPLIATAVYALSGEQLWSLGLYLLAVAVVGIVSVLLSVRRRDAEPPAEPLRSSEAVAARDLGEGEREIEIRPT